MVTEKPEKTAETPGQSLDRFLAGKRPRTEFSIDHWPERLKGGGDLWEMDVWPDTERDGAKWSYGAKTLSACVDQALRWEVV